MLNQRQNIPTVWSLFIALFTPGSQANHPSSTFGWLLPQVLPPPSTYSLPILITASRVDPGDTAWSRLCSRPCIDLLTRGNINNFCLWALWPLRPAPPLHHGHQSHTSFPCFFIVCSGCLFLLFPMPQQPWLTFSWFCLSLLLISTMSTILTTLQPAPSLSLLLLDSSSVSSYCPWFLPQHLCFSALQNMSPALSGNFSVSLNGEPKSPRTVTWMLRYPLLIIQISNLALSVPLSLGLTENATLP